MLQVRVYVAVFRWLGACHDERAVLAARLADVPDTDATTMCPESLGDVVRMRRLDQLLGGRPFLRAPGDIEKYTRMARAWIARHEPALGRDLCGDGPTCSSAGTHHVAEALRALDRKLEGREPDSP